MRSTCSNNHRLDINNKPSAATLTAVQVGLAGLAFVLGRSARMSALPPKAVYPDLLANRRTAKSHASTIGA